MGAVQRPSSPRGLLDLPPASPWIPEAACPDRLSWNAWDRLGSPSGLRLSGQWEAWGQGGGLGGHRPLQTVTAGEEAHWSELLRKSSHKSS